MVNPLRDNKGNVLGHWKFIKAAESLVFGKPTPIRTPPELGGELTKVVGMTIGDKDEPFCPVCLDSGPVHVIELENNIFVICCIKCEQHSWVYNDSYGPSEEGYNRKTKKQHNPEITGG